MSFPATEMTLVPAEILYIAESLLYHFLIHGIAVQVFSVSQNMQPITVRIKYVEYVLVRQLVQVRVSFAKKRQPAWTHREKLPKHGADESVFCCSHFSIFIPFWQNWSILAFRFIPPEYPGPCLHLRPAGQVGTIWSPSPNPWSKCKAHDIWPMYIIWYDMAQFVEAQEFSQTLHFLEPHNYCDPHTVTYPTFDVLL